MATSTGESWFPQVEAVLAEVPRLRGRGIDAIAPLGGGITNRNFRVDAGGEAFVVRIAGERTELLGIDRATEFACSQAAAALGIGAEVVAYLPDHAAFVTTFLDGQVLDADSLTSSLRDDDALLARVVHALRACHEGPAGVGRFCPLATVRNYQRIAGEHGVALPDEANAAVDEAATLYSGASETALCPCHNDLLPGNLIDDGQCVRIIDWEYAGQGDAWFDLGNLAENHRLPPRGEERLLSLYFGECRANDLARLRTMRRVSALREAMWGFVQSRVSRLEFDFLAYAQEHLARFHQQAST